jgi:hypothetical protein
MGHRFGVLLWGILLSFLFTYTAALLSNTLIYNSHHISRYCTPVSGTCGTSGRRKSIIYLRSSLPPIGQQHITSRANPDCHTVYIGASIDRSFRQSLHCGCTASGSIGPSLPRQGCSRDSSSPFSSQHRISALSRECGTCALWKCRFAQVPQRTSTTEACGKRAGRMEMLAAMGWD